MSGIELKGLKNLVGLESLLKENKETTTTSDDLLYLKTEQIFPGKNQPRTVFSDVEMNGLVSSVKENGIIQPLIVKRTCDDKFEIVAGERRWKAACKLGIEKVPAIVRDISDDVASVFALVENIQRENLSVVDQATALSRLVVDFSMTHEKIASLIGISRSSVTNYIRLEALPKEIKDTLKDRKIELGHAKLLLTLDEALQKKVVDHVLDGNLSVRETEILIKKLKLTNMGAEFHEDKFEAKNLKKEALCDELSKKLSRKIKIILNNKGYGKIEIAIKSIEDAENIINNITFNDTNLI